jgi:hypothetical protein
MLTESLRLELEVFHKQCLNLEKNSRLDLFYDSAIWETHNLVCFGKAAVNVSGFLSQQEDALCLERQYIYNNNYTF